MISLVNGTFRFANYYQDHMVLQRAPQRAVVWDFTDSFDLSISLTMNGKVYTTNFEGDSIWSVTIEYAI